ncbi:MAG: RimK family protein [Planctomycetes bacterium]|nr:RimK family protein [Planctomycetota bacterium]
MNNIVVVSGKPELSILRKELRFCTVLTAKDYLKDELNLQGKTRVFNLCNDYSYCKKGYYVSLLAEARGHRPFPSVTSISDFHSHDSIRLISENISDALSRSLKDLKSDGFELSIYFGKNIAQKYDQIAKQIFNHLQTPLMRVFCHRKDDAWHIKGIKPISFKDVPQSHYEKLIGSVNEFFGSGDLPQRKKSHISKYDLAILCNRAEEIPPSNEGAIKAFVSAAKELRMSAEIIGPKDIGHLSRFDALFIRETTSVSDHTFVFARKAELDGLVVIDDPLSILRCCNKIFLHDLLKKQKLSVPETTIIYKDTDLSTFTRFPLVIKKPDSAFSAGVKKVNAPEELSRQTAEYFKKSDLLIVQEFMKTDFDWRIGILDNRPLYACKYYMARDHWQIIKRMDGKTSEGNADSVPINMVPPKALQLAIEVCKKIGNGLYGVDIKEKNGQFFIIEVNDNPSIDKGCEDSVSGKGLYREIMGTFLRRLEAR